MTTSPHQPPAGDEMPVSVLPGELAKLAVPAGVILVCAVGVHDWPVASTAAARSFWPANLILLFWIAWLVVWLCLSGRRALPLPFLPPACVWAYLGVGVLSVAAAEDLGRSITTIAKTVLSLVGAYTLISVACLATGRRAALMLAMAIVTGLTILYAGWQSIRGAVPSALFESPLKLGLFLAMSVPCAASYIAARNGLLWRLWAGALALGALLVCASIWAWLGIVIGLVAGGVTDSRTRLWLAAVFLATALVIHFGSPFGIAHRLVCDFQYREDSGRDVRQRYLEWQALVNLIKERGAMGTGAGCINDRRSEYYLRLPKNNTLAAFDQNGWLAASAEAGLPGLLAMCWLFGWYLRRGWRRRRNPVARAAFAGLVAGSIAQLGSSLTYNGILVLFAILLALVDHGMEPAEHAPS